MMGADRERTLWWISFISLPALVVLAFSLNAWRSFQEYQRRTEIEIVGNASDRIYAGALWQVEAARLLGDGNDTPLRLPGERRLVILRLSATAVKDIGGDWSQCQISLVDGEGRRWLPLDVTLSNNVSRELNPKATPINGCGIASLTPLSKGENTLIEEKFLVPAPVAGRLSARISFAPSRPTALSIPLRLGAR
ncbi:hypothetical protein [Agrobacterium cavarae]|uniref:hypothetical protein n=1 Tax=Agrobacterium cavarae TaxID=2528239 RepID=UPI0013AF40DC|nr:hypothetical protein [Agrobacterium cavarae]